MNEYNRSERLHTRDTDKMKEDIDKRIDEERNKLKREKRVAERQNKTMKNLPNRKERDEIEALNKELKKLIENLKMKDQRHKLNIERLKKQAKEQKERNEELMRERDNVQQVLSGISGLDKEEDNEFNQGENNPEIENNKKSQDWQKPKSINFYEDTNVESKEDIHDYNDTSHSPHFGSQKFDFEDQQVAHQVANQDQQHNNYIKPSYEAPDSPQNQPESNSPSQASPQNPSPDQDQNQDPDQEPETYEMKFLPHYHNTTPENQTVIQENTNSDGKIVRWYANQKKEVIFK